jgi:LynF/TruF/PatF family peptide O-prenyltransferase
MIADVIKKDRLKEQKLQFIRNHQQAFDVEPIYPLPLFEDFVMSVEGDCSLEASCKIESDKLIASRFLLFFKDKAQQWQKYLYQSLTFFSQVETQVGVQIDYSLWRCLIRV